MDVVGIEVGTTDAGAMVRVGAGLTPSVGSDAGLPVGVVLPCSSSGDEFGVSGIDVVGRPDGVVVDGRRVGGGGGAATGIGVAGGGGPKNLSRNSFSQSDR